MLRNFCIVAHNLLKFVVIFPLHTCKITIIRLVEKRISILEVLKLVTKAQLNSKSFKKCNEIIKLMKLVQSNPKLVKLVQLSFKFVKLMQSSSKTC